MSRNTKQLYPDFSAFVDVIEKDGITPELLSKIINRHRANAKHNKELYDRYLAKDGALPISNRKPRFEEERGINNKLANDFFGEINDFKTGYFAGEPIGYSYSSTEEAEEVTGGKEAVEKATKTLTDFVTLNNMYGVDMEVTKFASIYGYTGRLMYVDPDANARVMAVHGFETIILSKTDISEPQYAIRYFKTYGINNAVTWVVEFYDNAYIHIYKGYLNNLSFVEKKLHLFDYCPLQGIANNKEMMGDAEKVLSLIDDYNKVMSDNSNEIEGFVHAIMLTSILGEDEDVDSAIEKANTSGIMNVQPVGTVKVDEPVKWVTKNINDAFTEHHLQRLEDNIYRFSRTPNLGDESFGSASGVSLKFKLHGLETKCGMFEAKMLDASQYMFKVLASFWRKKRIEFDPLQVVLDFKRNFPLDKLSEAQTAQALIAAGLPKRIAWSIAISGIDDIDYVLEILEQEKEDVTPLYSDLPIIDDDNIVNKATDKKSNEAELNTKIEK